MEKKKWNRCRTIEMYFRSKRRARNCTHRIPETCSTDERSGTTTSHAFSCGRERMNERAHLRGADRRVPQRFSWKLTEWFAWGVRTTTTHKPYSVSVSTSSFLFLEEIRIFKKTRRISHSKIQPRKIYWNEYVSDFTKVNARGRGQGLV